MNDDVPEGYWELLMAWLEKQPQLPDDDMTNDPPPIV